MLLEKVAEAEKIEIKPDEVEEEISKMAEYYRTTPEEVKSSLEKQGGTRTIENNLRTRKAIEALIANAKVVEGEWIDPNASEPIVQTEKPKKAAKGSAGAEEKPAKSAKKKTAKSKAQ
jgi:FKBP-type peptidyl-prolyl cis-trans isomerase (trigger factor)